MRTTLNPTATTSLPKIANTAAINNKEGASVKNKNLQDPAAKDELDAALLQKTSPQNYFYARNGAFAEGHYTEF